MSRRSVQSISPSKKTMESDNKIRNRKQDYYKISMPVDAGRSDIGNNRTGLRADRIKKEGRNEQEDKQSRKSVGGKQLKSDIEMNDQKYVPGGGYTSKSIRASKQSKGEETAQTDKESRKSIKPEKQKSKESQISGKRVDDSGPESLTFRSGEISDERGMTQESDDIRNVEERKNTRLAGKMRHLLVACLVAVVLIIVIISVAVTQTTGSKIRKITSKTAANIGDDVSDSTSTTTVTTSITSSTTTQPPLPPSCDFETSECGINITDTNGLPLLSSSPVKFGNNYFGRALISDIQNVYNINLTMKEGVRDVYGEYVLVVFVTSSATVTDASIFINTELTGTLLDKHCFSIDISYAKHADSAHILMEPVHIWKSYPFNLRSIDLSAWAPKNTWFKGTVPIYEGQRLNQNIGLRVKVLLSPTITFEQFIFFDNLIYAPCE